MKLYDLDQPKLLGSSEAIEARLMELENSHIAPLTDFVRKLRSKMGKEFSIPYFDPWDGGINAEVLFLLEAPGSKAVKSGFISRNNPDQTAKNFFELNQEASIDRKRTVIWNTVPWYIGTDNRIRAAKSVDITSGSESLAELFESLPKIRAVVLVGGKAQKVQKQVVKINSTLKIFQCPHPSPMFINRLPENREILLEKFREIQVFLDD